MEDGQHAACAPPLCDTAYHGASRSRGAAAVAARQWRTEPNILDGKNEVQAQRANKSDTGSSDDSSEVNSLEEATAGLSLDRDDDAPNTRMEYDDAPSSKGPGLAGTRQSSSSSLFSLGSEGADAPGSTSSSPRAGKHVRRNHGPGLNGCRGGTCAILGRCICERP